MKIRLRSSQPDGDACVLIPSAGRADVLARTLTNQSFLNRASTFVGLHDDEWKDYRTVRQTWSKITFIRYPNPGGSTVVAREELRRAAVAVGFRRYVCADDNTQYTEESLNNLIRASLTYKPQPVIVAGMQGSTSPNAKPSRFDEAYVKKSGHTIAGLRYYRKIGMMFWCFPHELYSKVAYHNGTIPHDMMGCMEDHSIALACLARGFTNFVICMDAPYRKKRFQPGGQGDPTARAQKIGLAWQRLGQQYPQFMSEVRMVWPYSKFYQIAKKREK